MSKKYTIDIRDALEKFQSEIREVRYQLDSYRGAVIPALEDRESTILDIVLYLFSVVLDDAPVAIDKDQWWKTVIIDDKTPLDFFAHEQYVYLYDLIADVGPREY